MIKLNILITHTDITLIAGSFIVLIQYMTMLVLPAYIR